MIDPFFNQERYPKIVPDMKYRIILTIAIISIFGNAYYTYAPHQTNWVGNFTDRGTSLALLQQSPPSILKTLKDVSDYRYDTAQIPAAVLMRNGALQTSLKGTSYYFSTGNGSEQKYFRDMYFNAPQDQDYLNLGSRAFMGAVASVKYFVIPSGEEAFLPYGYKKNLKTENGYTVYENDFSIPMVYYFDAYIPQRQFDELSVTQKQQALLQGAVVEDSNIPQAEIRFTDQLVNYEMKASDGIILKDGKIEVLKKDSKITLKFKGNSKCENYIIFDNLNYKYKNNPLFKKPPVDSLLYINTQKVASSVQILTNENNFYWGRHNFLCNLGYSEDGIDEVILSFSQTGTYTFDDITIVNQPMNQYEKDCIKLMESSCKDVWKYSASDITGISITDSNKFLCFSVPYHKGWKAYVDGEETQLLKANGMFMGIEVEGGEHDIGLRYETPYLKLGMLLTCIGFILTFYISKNAEKCKMEKKKIM